MKKTTKAAPKKTEKGEKASKAEKAAEASRRCREKARREIANATAVLAKVLDACEGAMSEYDVFDGFYAGGSESLAADFSAAVECLERRFGRGKAR